ncbi:MAG: hypothetical protein GKR98_17465 [Boseongicola sp.]|nr:MAG: hypothetical protein GKR98_17465 [Boseongicola sp.]
MTKEISDAAIKARPFTKYAYFILSSGLYCSYAAWKSKGEPNPFLKEKAEPRFTNRGEIDALLHSRAYTRLC